MCAQEVQAHQMGVQTRQQMEDTTELLIESGCMRVDEGKGGQCSKEKKEYV